MLASHSKFECLAKMVKRACDPVKPSLEKSLAKNREKLDEAYQELYHDFKLFKADVDDPDFNSLDKDGKDNYDHNDNWMEKIEEEYYDLIEKSDEKLEGLNPTALEQKVEQTEGIKEAKASEELKVKKLVENQINTEKKTIQDSITNISTTVSNFANNSIGASQGQALRSSLSEISIRIDEKLQKLYEQILKFLSDSEADNFQAEYGEFIAMQKARIDSIEMAIVTKTKEMSVPSSSRASGTGHTYLKKVDPPKFNGDILDFPEFKRKWAASVTREKLEEESELDRLRDNVPESARKMLIGEKSLANAWKILTKMYGNKTMLANKLKGKLKNVKGIGKADHDIIISLCIEVRSIICSLTELGMQDMLNYDDEYLSAVFRALPGPERTLWLKYNKDKYDTEWKAMEAFLDESHEVATSTKVLLSNYAAQDQTSDIKCKRCHKVGHKRAECPDAPVVNVAATKTKARDDSDDDSSGKTQLEADRVKARDFAGKCPLCKVKHTFRRKKDDEIWPSDRFTTCESFRKMAKKERAGVLEKNKACSRCTSWKHNKDSKDCIAPQNSCGFDKDGSGSKCSGDHSRMVCGSGNIYCAAAKFSKNVRKTSPTSKATDIVDTQELQADTILLLEDVTVKLGSSSTQARTFWDAGSNRVLINDQFAKDSNLRSQNVSYKIDLVGGKQILKKGTIYELEMVENSGKVHKIWGFGIDTIMDTPDIVDLEPVRNLFPHIPDHIFQPLAEKKIDILVGINYFSFIQMEVKEEIVLVT